MPLNFSGIPGALDGKLLKICVRVYVSLTGHLESFMMLSSFVRFLSGTSSAQDVTVVVSTPPFVHAVPKSIILQNVPGLHSIVSSLLCA